MVVVNLFYLTGENKDTNLSAFSKVTYVRHAPSISKNIKYYATAINGHCDIISPSIVLDYAAVQLEALVSKSSIYLITSVQRLLDLSVFYLLRLVQSNPYRR